MYTGNNHFVVLPSFLKQNVITKCTTLYIVPVPPSGGGGGGGGGAPGAPPNGITSSLHHQTYTRSTDSPEGAGGGGVAGSPPLVELSLLKLSRLGFWATNGEGRGALPPLVSRRPPIAGAGAGGGALSLGEVGPAELRGKYHFNSQCT